MRTVFTTARLVLAVVLTGAVVSGCAAATATPGAATRRLDVVTSFYPLQFAVSRIGGSAVRVSNLTKPGAEPHDLELSPRDVASIQDADLVVYLGGFQPAVDQAVRLGSPHALDVAAAAHLDLTGTGEGAAASGPRPDPHFWLDPTRLSAVAAVIAGRLTAVDPAHRDLFAKNLGVLDADLAALDGEFKTGLASCSNTVLVTSHSAFGYLSRRYGLTQHGITGLTPEDEPRARELAAVATLVRTRHVRTVYYETLVSPAVARTLARETGTRTAVLDPIEGLDAKSAGPDYLSVMRADLATLREGQPCR
jgi:zinc transport system substrate-binding protein